MPSAIARSLRFEYPKMRPPRGAGDSRYGDTPAAARDQMQASGDPGGLEFGQLPG